MVETWTTDGNQRFAIWNRIFEQHASHGEQACCGSELAVLSGPAPRQAAKQPHPRNHLHLIHTTKQAPIKNSGPFLCCAVSGVDPNTQLLQSAAARRTRPQKTASALTDKPRTADVTQPSLNPHNGAVMEKDFADVKGIQMR